MCPLNTPVYLVQVERLYAHEQALDSLTELDTIHPIHYSKRKYIFENIYTESYNLATGCNFPPPIHTVPGISQVSIVLINMVAVSITSYGIVLIRCGEEKMKNGYVHWIHVAMRVGQVFGQFAWP